MYKLAMMLQNTLSKKDAVELPLSEVQRNFMLPRTVWLDTNKALQEHKLSLDSQRTFFADEFLEEKGYKFSKQLFKHDPQTDAIITTDSLLAEGVCNYLSEHNLNIPVLSFDSV